MNTDFTTAFEVKQTPAEVFEAINNVGLWWQGTVDGPSHKLNDTFTYRMKEFHYSQQKVVEMIPNTKVVWLITDSNLTSFPNKTEWTGTKIVFEIEETNGHTRLRFTHLGLAPKFECYGACSNAWTRLVQESLHSLITTGKGKDVF